MLTKEQLVPLPQLAKGTSPIRLDRPVAVSTVHRWRDPGIRGVRLECVRIGGRWLTSVEAFERFCETLTATT